MILVLFQYTGKSWRARSGPKQARYGPVMTGPLRVRYDGPVTGPFSIHQYIYISKRKWYQCLPQDLYHVTCRYIPIKSYLIMPYYGLLNHALTRVYCFSYTKYWSLTSYIDTICTHHNPMLCKCQCKMNNAYNMKILLNWSFWRYWIHKTYFFLHFQRFILEEKNFFLKIFCFLWKKYCKICCKIWPIDVSVNPL